MADQFTIHQFLEKLQIVRALVRVGIGTSISIRRHCLFSETVARVAPAPRGARTKVAFLPANFECIYLSYLVYGIVFGILR